ncbi:MAG: carboxypeptidase regulatory-like domain-containing protein [Dokdonella sp.]
MTTPRLLVVSLVLALTACAESSQKPAPMQPAYPQGNAKASAAPASIAAPSARAVPATPSAAPAAVETPVASTTAEKSGTDASVVDTAKKSGEAAKPATPSVKPPRNDAGAAAGVASVPAVAQKPIVAPLGAASSLSGHVQLTSDSAVSADEVATVAVYFIPDKGAVHAKPDRYLMYTHEKKFDPESLVVPVGSTVKFPNRDEILHNVFSATGGSQFDLGLIGEDASGEHTFTKPGLVLVNCNVHSAMQATVLVVDTPFFARTTRDGRFSLEGLPAGPGKLTFWHPRAGFQSVAVTLPVAAPIEQSIRLTKPRVEAHMNKEGKPYQNLSH